MQQIETDTAPISSSPLSQAIVHGDTVYVSGQVPVDPETGAVVSDDIREQTAQTLENIAAILEAAGTSIDNVVKTTVFLTDMDEFAAMNEVYSEYMGDPRPARSAVEVADLAIDIGVEIEAIATI